MSYQRWKSQASQTVRKFKTTAIEELGGTPDPNTLISTAGGNWNVANLQDGSHVQSGIHFGLSQVGVFVGSGPAPGVPIIYAIGGISETTIRITPGLTQYVDHLEIWRADTQTGTYALIGTMAAGATFYDDTTLSPGQTAWYELRGVSSVPTYSAFSAPASGESLTSEGIEVTLWQNLITYMQNDVSLSNYIQQFKFDLESKIIPDTSYPMLKGWVLKTTEKWVAVPKWKMVIIHFAFHGLVQSRDEFTLESEKLNMSTRIKNALERGGMDLAGVDTLNLVGDTVFHNLDSYRAEVFVTAELWSIPFSAGNR